MVCWCAVLADAAATGAVASARFGRPLLTGVAAGVCVSSLVGAVLPFADAGNDQDVQNTRYFAQVEPIDLVIGFHEIQSKNKIDRIIARVGFGYYNLFNRAHAFRDIDYEDLVRMTGQALQRRGRVYVDPYVVHPPRSIVEFVTPRNSNFEADRERVLAHLRSLPAGRVVWVDPVGITSQFFVL